MSEPTREPRLLLAHVDIGLAIKQFLQSDVGQYLIGRAAETADEAMQKLKGADPEDAKLIRALQNEIKMADSFAQWITDGKLEGEHAELELHQQEQVNNQED